MSNLTNFQKVGEFHELFEHPKNDTLNKQNLEDDKLVKLRIALINEEFEELKEALKNKDSVEVADALSDILYVVYGAGQVFGINLDETFDKVHKSNMTKACLTEEQAKETVEYIKQTQSDKYKNPGYKLSKDGKYYIVYDQDTGKTLKNKYYEAVDLSYIKLSKNN